MKIDAANLSHKELNDALRKDERRFTLTGCCGQRFIAAGMSDKDIAIEGIAGNALGAYLNGACLTVNANAQDAVGDTMNEGKIIADDIPERVFSQVELLRGVGLTVPETTELMFALNQEGWDLPLDALSVEACAQAIAAALR